MKKKFLTALLTMVASVPLPLLYAFSDFIFYIVYRVLGYRRKVVRQNLEESFPEKTAKEISGIEKEYYHFMCDIIVETIKLLNISDKEMASRVEVVNPEAVQASIDEGRSVALLLGHYANWEWVQQISPCFPRDVYKASIYHPLMSKLWDDIYNKVRSRWKAHIVPQGSAVRALLDRSHQPWICGFIADARPRFTEQNARTEFLNHSTSFIYGPEVIGRKVGADFFFLEMNRVERGRYRITFHQLQAEEGTDYPVMREFWHRFEKVIKEKPAYWLWSHKRWKYDNVMLPETR